VPAEGVYYELIENPDLMEYASKKRVFPASPMTFWALLQVTVIGFRGLQISENAKRISGLLDGMRGDMDKFKDAFRKASTQVKNASSNMDEAREQLEAVDAKLLSIRTTQNDKGTNLKADTQPTHRQLFEE
jgi:DNA anti-recombination protein RmuC